MPDKPIALVVDDDAGWLQILEEVLNPFFVVEKARSLAVAQPIISNKGQKIKIALVDLRLEEDEKTKQSGLDAMFLLNKEGVPCIVATAAEDGETIRKAFAIGHAKDVWFKTEELVTLRQKIDDVLKFEKERGLIKKQSDFKRNADAVESNIKELELSRKQVNKYKKSYLITAGIIWFLTTILIFSIPIATSWNWLLNHPKQLGLQISFSLITLGVIWIIVDTDNTRRWFALGSIVVATLIAITQII